MILMGFQEGPELWRLEVRGHAEYNPGGPDILCAAASVLCCALGRALEASGAPELAVLQSPGRFVLQARPETPAQHGMIALVRTGLDMLAERYPGHIAWAEDAQTPGQG